MKKEQEPIFDENKIKSVKLNLLNGQVDIILRSLELYSYNLEYMLNSEKSSDDEREEKIALLKYTFEQVLSTQAEQVNGKSNNIEDLSSYGRKMINDSKIVSIASNNSKKINVG